MLYCRWDYKGVFSRPQPFCLSWFSFSKTVPEEAFIGFPFGPSALLKIINVILGIFEKNLLRHVFFNKLNYLSFVGFQYRYFKFIFGWLYCKYNHFNHPLLTFYFVILFTPSHPIAILTVCTRTVCLRPIRSYPPPLPPPPGLKAQANQAVCVCGVGCARFAKNFFSLISEIKRIWIRFTCVSLFHYTISLFPLFFA